MTKRRAAAPPRSFTNEEAELVGAADSLLEPADLMPKQVVRWKQGLQRPGLPPGPFVVTQVLDAPRPAETADPLKFAYYEPLDLVVGYWTPIKDGEGKTVDRQFVEMHIDRRRVEPA